MNKIPDRPLDPPEHEAEPDEDALYEEQRQQRIDDLRDAVVSIATPTLASDYLNVAFKQLKVEHPVSDEAIMQLAFYRGVKEGLAIANMIVPKVQAG